MLNMNKYTRNIILVRDLLGSYNAVGAACGNLSGTAIRKWRNQGFPPRTEYTGETKYAQMLEKATGGRISASSLIPKKRINDGA